MKIGLLPLYLALYDNHCQEAAAKARTFIDVIAGADRTLARHDL